MKESSSPIKRHSALLEFSREHHFGLLLVWKIRQGLKRDIDLIRITDYTVFFFEKDLIQHFKEEEKNLFSKLPADDLLRQQALREHEKIYTLVDNLRKNKMNANLLTEFADTLENHIRFEERILFNHLENNLSEDELTKLVEEHGKKVIDVDTKWDDHFWIIK